MSPGGGGGGAKMKAQIRSRARAQKYRGEMGRGIKVGGCGGGGDEGGARRERRATCPRLRERRPSASAAKRPCSWHTPANTGPRLNEAASCKSAQVHATPKRTAKVSLPIASACQVTVPLVEQALASSRPPMPDVSRMRRACCATSRAHQPSPSVHPCLMCPACDAPAAPTAKPTG